MIFKIFKLLWAFPPQISAIVKKQYREKIKCAQLHCLWNTGSIAVILKLLYFRSLSGNQKRLKYGRGKN